MTTLAIPRIGLLAAVLVAALAGCHRRAPAPDAAPALATDGQIRWRGRARCADCDGIDAQLTLRRAGRLSEFTLVETYYNGRRGIRFVDHGRWQQSGGLVRLRGDGGSTRVYALLPDGRLQAAGAHGAPLSTDAAALVPVSASEAP